MTESLESNSFLAVVTSLLPVDGGELLYPCVRDLVENGLDPTRFAPGDPFPCRQDVTQYLAAWSRRAGLTDEQTRAWLMEYCVAVLGPLSKRTPAAIRHSTKGNINYIYKSEVPFICNCEANPFRARCGPECRAYAEMEAKRRERGNEPPGQWRPPRPPAAPIIALVPVRAANREQYETALSLIREEHRKRTKPRRIIELLHERGLKTKTGRPWTSAILSSTLRQIAAETPDGAGPVNP